MRNQRIVRAAALVAAMTLTGVTACGGRDNNTASGGNGGGSTPAGGPVTVKKGPGVTDTEITLGVLTPLTGRPNVIGLPLTAGNDLYVQQLNAKGGVAGKYKVVLKKADTKYEANTAIQLYGQMKGEVAAFAQILGTPIVDPLKQKLTQDKILAQPATLDAFWVNEPNLAPIGAPYQIQVINGLDYATRKLDAKNKKVCALTADDAYGETGLKGYDYAIDKLGLTSTAKVKFTGGSPDFTAQISQLQGAGCEIVVLASLASDAGILSGSVQKNYAPTWLGLSPTYLSAFSENAALGAYMAKNFKLIAEGPNWGDESVPGMKEQIDAVKQFAPETKPDGYFTFGYNEMRAVHQILEQAVKDGDLTQEGIVKASHNVEKLTFGDVYGDYKYGDPADREPPRTNSIFAVEPGKPNGTNLIEKVTSQPAKDYDDFG